MKLTVQHYLKVSAPIIENKSQVWGSTFLVDQIIFLVEIEIVPFGVMGKGKEMKGNGNGQEVSIWEQDDPVHRPQQKNHMYMGLQP